MATQQADRQDIVMKVTTRTIVINILLSIFKLAAGILGNSSAMIADAIHSISDFATTVVVRIGVKASNKASDEEHPYGHERMESIAVLVVAVILGMTGVWIGIDAISHMVTADYFAVPGLIALVAAVAGIALKEGMFWYVRAAAKKTNSDALMADAWHSRSDGLSSIGSLLGILGARAGFPILDSLAGVVICVFIIKVAFDIAKGALGKLTDHACDAETLEQIRKIILSYHEVKQISRLQSRLSGNGIYVDADISLDGDLSFFAAHTISDNIHDGIEQALPGVKHCMIHAEPYAEAQ